MPWSFVKIGSANCFAWQLQAINGANLGLSSTQIYDMHITAIRYEMLQISK